jgi:hypothetical protein
MDEAFRFPSKILLLTLIQSNDRPYGFVKDLVWVLASFLASFFFILIVFALLLYNLHHYRVLSKGGIGG